MRRWSHWIGKMTSPPNNKRKFVSGRVSPPPMRRRVQSSTTQNAVSSFFTPASQKLSDKMIWQERASNVDSSNTLIVGKYQPSGDSVPNTNETPRIKIAAFDFDSTLINTKSGKKFASDAEDWKWWDASVPATLRKLFYEDGYKIVVLSNQAGISLKVDSTGPKSHKTKFVTFKAKVAAVFNQLDFPISIYAATEKDIFRKPRTGMWTELLDDYDIALGDLNIQDSIFVGDAGGRLVGGGKPKDFSCSDRNFAANVGLTFFTPEEYFLQEESRPFAVSFDTARYLPGTAAEARDAFVKKNTQDLVVLCGSPGAGKSTYYWKQLEPLGYARVNQDILKSRERCLKVANQYLEEGLSVAVDATNADTEVRANWVRLAKKHAVPIRCVLFTADTAVCEHNDVVRALNDSMNPEKRSILPSVAFRGFSSRYQQPVLSEGFQDISEVHFKFEGNAAERDIWTRHWT